MRPKNDSRQPAKLGSISVRFSPSTNKMMKELRMTTGLPQTQLYDLLSNAALTAIKEEDFRLTFPIKLKVVKDH